MSYFIIEWHQGTGNTLCICMITYILSELLSKLSKAINVSYFADLSIYPCIEEKGKTFIISNKTLQIISDISSCCCYIASRQTCSDKGNLMAAFCESYMYFK